MSRLVCAASRATVITALAAGVVLSSWHPAPAALITGLYTGNVGNTTYDLTAIGTNDWAYWSSTAGSGASGAPKNDMSGGTLIGSMSAVGGGTLRGSTSPTKPAYDFAYGNGTSPASGIESNVVGLFNTQLSTAGAGVTVSVTLPTTGPYTVSVWVSGFEGIGRFTASLPGATDYVDTSFTAASNNPKVSSLYTLTATPDTANDVLTLQFVLDSSSGANSHTLVSGLALSAVPEPASAGLLALAFLVLRRRLRTTVR